MKKNKYWFMPKQYGYGMTPCSWEGWLWTFGLLLLILGLGYFNGLFNETAPLTERELILYLLEIIGITYAFIRLAKTKMKEDLKWRWGDK